MGNVVLIVAVPVLMALGFFAVNRLDHFLYHNRIAIGQNPSGQENVLRIAFSNPLVAGAVTASLERLCKLHTNTEIYLYAGDADAILTQLATKEIDIAFLSDPAAKDAADAWEQICVSLPSGILRGGDCTLPILALREKESIQWITWNKDACACRAEEFMTLLEKDLRLPGRTGGRNML